MNEKNILKRELSLFPAICVVVGFIVGTGIFWRPGRVLFEVGGDVRLGVLAWLAGGLLIAPCVYMFAVMAARHEKVHGMVDYAEAFAGKKFGYLCGWFFCIMYQSAGYAVIAFITASFTAALTGHDNPFFIAAFFMTATFVLNFFWPKLMLGLNTGTTVARLIPLVLMGTAGVIIANLTAEPAAVDYSAYRITLPSPSFPAAVFSTVFAFGGWQAAVAFNSEVKNSRRNFPIALLSGFFVVVIIYVLYFYGLATAANPWELMANNQMGTRNAFSDIFGAGAGNVLMGFVIISGLGILNMCCRGMSRGLYSLARRGLGPMPGRMVALDEKTGVPVTSMVMCVGVSFLWLLVILGNQQGRFTFDLPDFYNMGFFALIIPIFIGFCAKNRKNKDINRFNRQIAPVLAVLGAGSLLFFLARANLSQALIYAAVFMILAVVSVPFYNNKRRKT